LHNNKAYINNDPWAPPQGLPRAGHATFGYVVTLPPATLTHRLRALRWQRPSGAPSAATSSRSRHLWLLRHATNIYIDTPPSDTLSATTLRDSLGGYLELVVPPLATSSCCHQLRRHVASRHSVGNDPRVLPRGLPRVSHATTIYIDTLPSLTSSAMAA
jgi:hypothetical protein